ncbi:hypothetical protein ABZY16_13420 [Streptomyces sp. NPDC006553]|uniref:hypothetical protein n=1 Tax=unclassified Streptomyces TaxID=2593676 RepID=UPI002254D265|nr:hypothetical protein [Streptomyces sp. NBC_00233]MCX5228579.1 hypothetical protein [Streptomyces sp. NBC_00233]
MLSSARFATFAHLQVRPVLALLVPAAAALTLVLAAEPASAGATAVAASDVVPAATATAQTDDSDNGFSWG